LGAYLNCLDTIGGVSSEFKRIINDLAYEYKKTFNYAKNLEQNIDILNKVVILYFLNYKHRLCERSDKDNYTPKYVTKSNNHFRASILKQSDRIEMVKPEFINFVLEDIKRHIKEFYDVAKSVNKEMINKIESQVNKTYHISFSYEHDFLNSVQKLYDDNINILEALKFKAISNQKRSYHNAFMYDMLVWYCNITDKKIPASYIESNPFIQFFKKICSHYKCTCYKSMKLFRIAHQKYLNNTHR
jgi:hypothetical protein